MVEFLITLNDDLFVREVFIHYFNHVKPFIYNYFWGGYFPLYKQEEVVTSIFVGAKVILRTPSTPLILLMF